MATYLVTGGAGFIGSHIVERLLKDGHKVRVLDNFVTGKEENLDFINALELSADSYKLIKGDIRDEALTLEVISGVDYILHQAALRSVPKSVEDPASYTDVNVKGTLNLLQAARINKIKRFVFASSSSVYGERKNFPEKETDSPNPISPYAVTKLCAEFYCKMFSATFGLETVVLRYFNVFGPRQSLENQYAVVVPKFITSLLNNESPPVYGDGRQSRDFTYIDNVVEANILAVTKSNISGQVFNVASGKDFSVIELANKLKSILGKNNIEPIFLSPRPGDVKRTLADISKAKKLLGYDPSIDFDTGLKQTVEWYRANKANISQ